MPKGVQPHTSVIDKTTLNQNTTGEFLERFDSFHDSLLRKIEISYTEDGKRSVTVWIETRDAQETKNNGWVCVRLVVSDVHDFCFTETWRTSYQVISLGVHICWFAEVVGIDFGHFCDPPIDLADQRSSKFFITGHSVEWTVEPY